MGSCKDCSYWLIDNDLGDQWGKCSFIPDEGMLKNNIAFTRDGQGYGSELYTMGGFGCSLFKQRSG